LNAVQPWKLSSISTLFLENAPARLEAHRAIFQRDKNPICLIPRIHPKYSDIKIHPDINELTFNFGNITYCYFSNFERSNNAVKITEQDEFAVQKCLAFLNDVLTDRVELVKYI
jgi:hypothetical protein